jgi:hypothetical protein
MARNTSQKNNLLTRASAIRGSGSGMFLPNLLNIYHYFYFYKNKNALTVVIYHRIRFIYSSLNIRIIENIFIGKKY